MDRRRAGRDILVCFLCAHPTITIREHLLDRVTEVRKTLSFLSAVYIHFRDCFISFLLWRDILLSRKQPETCVGTFSHNATSCFFHATKTPISTERVVYLT